MSSKKYKKPEDFSHLRNNLKQFKRLKKFGNYKKMAEDLRISDQYLSDIVRGRVEPSPRLLQAMAKLFGLSEEDLLSDLSHPRSNEQAESYNAIKIDPGTEKILNDLLKSGDREIINHLKRQVLLLKDLLDRRKRDGDKPDDTQL